jgi:hypothetical protein
VAGYVGDQDAEVLVVDDEEVVEIAGDGAHGDVASSDFEARYARNRLGQGAILDLAGKRRSCFPTASAGRVMKASVLSGMRPTSMIVTELSDPSRVILQQTRPSDAH